MALLRRLLYWQAFLWAAVGLAIVLAPGWTVERVFDQPPVGEDAWLRVAGVSAIALAAQAVLISHRVEDLWWWSWTFVLLEAGTATVLLLNALVGVPEGAPTWPWWLLGSVSAAFGAMQLAALAKAGTERPPA